MEELWHKGTHGEDVTLVLDATTARSPAPLNPVGTVQRYGTRKTGVYRTNEGVTRSGHPHTTNVPLYLFLGGHALTGLDGYALHLHSRLP